MALLLLCSCASFQPVDYDCDDMTQILRDEMVASGIPESEITLCSGTHRQYLDQHHFWLEYKGLVYDPASDALGVSRGPYYTAWYVVHMPGGAVYLDGSGYMKRGDRYVDGKWVR